ncbi:MAG: alpha/beta hydrolase [Acidobacteria bacterium]|nr:alpha/beta hydrolase [Acidobacteriota bacterium]
MDNFLNSNDWPPNRKGFFGLPRTARMAVYLPVIAAVFFFGLRRIEQFMTHHPVRYSPGAEWRPPANGEDVWINVADGERIHGWFLKSKAQPALATILHCHGNGGNITNTVWYGQALAEDGFDVLLFDYRGYGRSDGDVTDEWALDADGEAAYNYLLNERGVKPSQLVLYGMSLGTTVAIDVASRKPAGALVVESGLSSADEMGAYALPILPGFLRMLAKNRFESAHKIASVHCPVLVAHGTDDQTIPVAQGRKLFASANEPKQQIIIEGGSHNLAGPGGDAYRHHITDFIHDAMARQPN